MVVEPETFRLEQNPHAPNSDKPVLIYRDCLPLPLSEDRAKDFLESHAWKQGGTWGHISKRHFHPNTHECYSIFEGESTLLLGYGHSDDEVNGLKVNVRADDVIVLPAGTAHCNLESSKGYRYIGLYPDGAPKWRQGRNWNRCSEGRSRFRSSAEPRSGEWRWWSTAQTLDIIKGSRNAIPEIG